MQDKHCEVCGVWGTELHHIIYKSQAKYMSNIPINFKFLCTEHHRGKNGPHMNRETDLQYKKELQCKLEELFYKDYYNIHQIRQLLEISKSEAEKIVNKLPVHKEGYDRLDIVKKCLGGKFYD